MDIKKEKNMMPNYNEKKHYKKEIVDILDKIEDERFLKRVYIILMNHAKKRGS